MIKEITLEYKLNIIKGLLIKYSIDPNIDFFKLLWSSKTEEEYNNFLTYCYKNENGINQKNISYFLDCVDEFHKNINKLDDDDYPNIIYTKPEKVSDIIEKTANQTEKRFIHYQSEDLLNIVKQKLHVYMVGPAGSGKTHTAEWVAKQLNLNFYFTGAVNSETKLTGFTNAIGNVVRTQFREAFENGGLFLFDEIDGSFSQALLTFNAALANGWMDFPDKKIHKHPDFYCIAAANTYGLGADRQYVGRQQLDAASLDRFIFLNWEYDEILELSLCDNTEWVRRVQIIRDVVKFLKIRHVVSMRACIDGNKLLNAGFSLSKVEDLVLYKGLDDVNINKIRLNFNNIKSEYWKTKKS